LKQQVDDFAVASDTQQTCDILFDMTNDRLMLPLKQLGLINLFNGLDVEQTRDYVKVFCETYIDKISKKHLANWMGTFDVPVNCLTPLPSRSSFMKNFLAATGDPDPKI